MDADRIARARKTTNGSKLAVYEIRDVYGRPLAYPINDRADQLQNLTGKKTLRRSDISKIVDLGFQVVTVHGEPLNPSMID
tara:strand:+ start:196 stop:438 length:243 start_codon:yes stop_codon:yes gene_type:complete